MVIYIFFLLTIVSGTAGFVIGSELGSASTAYKHCLSVEGSDGGYKFAEFGRIVCTNQVEVTQ